MKRSKRRMLNRKILGMVVVPAVIAGILFSCVVEKSSPFSAGGSGGEGGAASVQTETESGSGKGAGTGGADSAQAAAESSGSSQPAAEPAQENPDTGEAIFGRKGSGGSGVEPIQRIAFTAGRGDARQRSIPVQIDAGILGGVPGELCWAVFLPSEMAARPQIVFTDYDNVTFEPLESGERLPGGRLRAEGDSGDPAAGNAAGGAAQAAEDTAGETSGPRVYSSGDPAEGLSNGSAFRVRMAADHGSVPEEVLYVFSCTGTATMYLDTESGSMENVDGDATKQTSEAAQFLVCGADGTVDSRGGCSVSGRGNSTWKMNKRPYNLNLTEKQSVLGMETCKKLCLISNSFDLTNLLDRISARLADSLQMRDTPDGEFVNLYLNGKYNGLYYLSQRVRTGGSVHIDKLDEKILEANGQSEKRGNGVNLPKKIALFEKGDRLKKYAYDWPAEPKNNTGGYLLQQYVGYKGEDCWFSTAHRRYRIMSPAWPTVGEVNYLQDYMLSAERAIYSEDGTDPETGKSYESFLDMASWEDMYLLEEFFVEWDAERWSFFITKDKDDPLLYCGPMWDFDHSAGSMIYGSYPETAVSTLLFRDTRHGWMYKLITHESFENSLHDRWLTRFSPALHSFLEGDADAGFTMEGEIAAIESSAYMNNIRRDNDTDFRTDAETLRTWLRRRAAFLDDYCVHADRYCRVEFVFPWGSLSHYVPRGSVLGYLPLAEYGETQISSQIEKHEIIGWQDEDGNPITADQTIDGDRVFTPVYRTGNPAEPAETAPLDEHTFP
ncbi:MAG: CotH kinase family protein [Eubacteriales bacterium]|nr:CotH kinase family protein [Eubacteriales bacterium]